MYPKEGMGVNWKDGNLGKEITLLENLEQDGFLEGTQNQPGQGRILGLILKLGVIFTLVFLAPVCPPGLKPLPIRG